MPLLTVHLQPSNRLTVILGLAHLFAMGLLWSIALPIIIKLVSLTLLILSLIYYMRQYALLNNKSAIVTFEILEGMCCGLTTLNGQTVICRILSSTFVSSYLVVLNLKPFDHFLTRSVIILPDRIDAEVFRQLRVLLRWKWKDIL